MSKILMSTLFLALGFNVEWHTGHLGRQKSKIDIYVDGAPSGLGRLGWARPVQVKIG